MEVDRDAWRQVMGNLIWPMLKNVSDDAAKVRCLRVFVQIFLLERVAIPRMSNGEHFQHGSSGEFYTIVVRGNFLTSVAAPSWAFGVATICHHPLPRILRRLLAQTSRLYGQNEDDLRDLLGISVPH